MTLVIATNLSDRIYISADSRLSRKKEDGSFKRITDSLLKVLPINEHIAVGCVGSAPLAQFLIEKLKKTDLINKDISTFRKGAPSEIKKIVGEYLEKAKLDYSKVHGSFIFGCFDVSKKRILQSRTLIDLVKKCQDLDQEHINSKYKDEDIKSMSQGELESFVMDITQRKMNMKDVIFKGLMSGNKNVKNFEINVPEHKLFVVDINCEKQVPDETVLVHDCGWGEYIVRGGGYKEEMLPKDFICDIDLRAQSGNLTRDCIPFTHYIYEKFSDTIEGSVITTAILNGEIVVPTGKIARFDKDLKEEKVLTETAVMKGRFWHKKNNLWNRLYLIGERENDGECYL